jgi:hypothetical protein
MSSSDDGGDERLRRALQSLPVPEPPNLERRVYDRLWQRRRMQRGGATGVVAALLLAVVFAGPWGRRKDEPIVFLPFTHTPREIPADDLEVLFAPPPVDSLAVLDRRDAVSVAALTRLEGVK